MSPSIKLLSKWTFDLTGSRDWRGIWEIEGVKDPEGEPIYTIRRVLTSHPDCVLDERLTIPEWLILEQGTRITIVTKPPPHGV